MMKQAEALTRSGDLKGAEQKYQFAALIKQNGPGQPQDRLQELRAAEAQAANAKPAPPPAQPPVPVQPQALSKPSQPTQTSNNRARTQISSIPAPHERGLGLGDERGSHRNRRRQMHEKLKTPPIRKRHQGIYSKIPKRWKRA